MPDPAADIRARRDASNAAIARRDASATVAIMRDAVTVAVAGGPVLRGRLANRDAFASQFADHAFAGYVRTPDTITIDASQVRATETGQWRGTWLRGFRREEMRGSYQAQWCLADGTWFIESEIFVELPR